MKLYLWKLNLYCSQLLFQFLTLFFFTLYSCRATSTSISFFSRFLSLFFWIFNKVNIQFWGLGKLRWDLILEYGFAFLIYMYKSYLLFFNDWQSRLIIARCLTFVPPFRARPVFLGLMTPCLSIQVVVQSLCYGCQFWTVSDKLVPIY